MRFAASENIPRKAGGALPTKYPSHQENTMRTIIVEYVPKPESALRRFRVALLLLRIRLAINTAREVRT